MGWKIYWAISLLLFAIGAFGQLSHPLTQPPIAWVILPISALAQVGLFAFAFQRTLQPGWLWRGLWRPYIAVVGVNAWDMFAAAEAATHKLASVNGVALGISLVIVAAVLLALCAPVAYALWAYDQRVAHEPRLT
jgi:hypothetical protein